tara:strand:+ start:294 stop:2072 length:1779 start_codon:yes stop_codon:yes gene_type:complete
VNLKELTEEINSALDYNPDLEAYKSQVARVINRHYLQCSSQYNWLFRQKRVPLTLRADIKGNSTTNKLRVGQSTTFDASNVLSFIGTADTLPTYEMLGNTLIINDNDTFTTLSSSAHGASELEFTINGIYDLAGSTDEYGSAGRYGGTGSPEWPDGYQPGDISGIVIDRPLIDPSTTKVEDGSTVVDTKDFYTDWSIEFRQYYLPPDCVEVLGIVDRGLKTSVHSQSSSSVTTSIKTAPDRGRLIFIDASKEEHLYLDRDSTGDPVIGIEGMPRSLTPPMVPPVLTEEAKDTDKEDLKMSALIGGDTYEYCYTFVKAGMESAPSPITRITLSTDSDLYSVDIQSEAVEGDFRRDGTSGRTDEDLESRGSAKSSADKSLRLTGTIKRFYRRKVMAPSDKVSTQFQGHQRWLHIGDHFTDGSVLDIGRKQTKFAAADASRETFPDDFAGSRPVLGWPNSQFLELGQWTYHDGELSKLKVLDESGPRQTMRVYRPPSQDMDVEIRYLARPKRLVADSDVPEWPVQYHHLLVYMALADICLQHGMSNQAQLYERKTTDLLDRMKQKYLSRTNRKYIRRGFDRIVFAGERFGVPTKV